MHVCFPCGLNVLSGSRVSFRSHVEANAKRGLALARSAVYFTFDHPESELTTAKKIQNVVSKPIKQKLKRVKRKNNAFHDFQYFHTGVVFLELDCLIAAHSY
ncbi:hypothetical protein TNCV_2733001 [Trichonephila clavipes]|nr:hypothetical protein TNCV_2733001 [Trichonephila clavipes]